MGQPSEECGNSKDRKDFLGEHKQDGSIPLLDMHSHLPKEDLAASEELEYRKKQGIVTCLSAGTLNEWQRMLPLKGREELILSFGIHPWNSLDESVYPCQNAFKECSFIGEIGMDCVWCDVPLPIQRLTFSSQLVLAAIHKKPVLLHTKGCEEEIGEWIEDFGGKVCVHWYSGSLETLKRCAKRDCFFTLGPDLALCLSGKEKDFSAEKKKQKELYQWMLENIPPSRLFLETDGLSSIAWAYEKAELPLEEISKVLGANAALLSEAWNLPLKAVKGQLLNNLKDFLA